MVKILKRCLLLGKKVLYKSPIDITPPIIDPSCHKWMIFILAKLLEQLYLGDGTPPKKKKMLRKFTYIDTFMPIYEPKCPIPIA